MLCSPAQNSCVQKIALAAVVGVGVLAIDSDALETSRSFCVQAHSAFRSLSTLQPPDKRDHVMKWYGYQLVTQESDARCEETMRHAL